MFRSVTAAVVAFVVVAATVIGASAFSFGKYEKVKVVNGAVSIPTAKVNDGKARYFKYSDGGKEISFFIVKAADGTFRTAFDACDACFREKKGYEQHGDKMVCKNCNMRFATNRIGPHAVGGCNPSHLPSVTSGGTIVIKADDLQQGARYF
ncbi:DUF2318 domain-containing protein [Trichlorobacter ammonificans]|uniref:Membrane iron-sulfur containing protein FtrD-like domain-containing protein n=1 Tax=Trichlorobacter ammonificans TaxID=2916410 RepID=A0ABN8HHU4_9BACT|nr:DUF2318 domain-containing protein [Trichlorobacter ammonificans]CAH2030390.1 conserved protein of unknown function [Trichlorobacter ammonificans]